MTDQEAGASEPEAREEPQADQDLAGEVMDGDSAPVEVLLEDARTRADEHWNQCLRLQAEVENLQRRAARDLENAHKFGLERFAGELLPVKDSLEMGIAAAGEASDTLDPVKLKEGAELTLKMLATAMEKFGITEVNPEGDPFNPEFHQAMTLQERADVDPNTVVAVVQKGYLLNNRLVRPAMVIVSKAPGDG